MKSIFSKYTNLALAFVASATLAGCALDAVPAPTYAELAIVNAVPAAPSNVALVAGTAPRLEVNVDGVDLMSDSLQTSSFRGYFPLTAGSKSIKLTAANAHPTAGITLGQEFHKFTFNGVNNTFASAFVFTENGAITSLTVTDDLATPASGKVHVRVVNLTNNEIDVVALATGTIRTSAGRDSLITWAFPNQIPAVITGVKPTVLPTVVPATNFISGVKAKSASSFTPINAVPLMANDGNPLRVSSTSTSSRLDGSFVRANYIFQVRLAGTAITLPALASLAVPSAPTITPAIVGTSSSPTFANNANANTATLENQRIYTIVVRTGATATAPPVVFGYFNNRR